MNEKQLEEILLSPISFIRLATEEEKGIFPDKDKEKNFFYKFGMASGQRFVSAISKKDMGSTYVFRPLNSFLPKLKEISWAKRIIIGSGCDVTTKVTLNSEGTEEERKMYEQILRPRQVSFDRTIMMASYQYHPLLKKAIDLQNVLYKIDENKKEAEILQHHLEEILTTRKDAQSIQQKGKEKEEISLRKKFAQMMLQRVID